MPRRGALAPLLLAAALACLAFASMALAPSALRAEVTAGEGEIWLPTYPWDPSARHPSFRETDGRNIYPYPMLDNLSREKTRRRWRTVILENQYLRVTFLPELGGRIYEVLDKTTSTSVFYLNRVVKPGLIGQCGAWISGGIEFNTGPQGHTVSAVLPVDVEILPRAADGSRSVAVGEVERIYRTRWTVVVTLRPGRSFLEETIRIYNRTETVRPYYFWNCTAVPSTPGFRFIYPMTLGTDHAGTSFYRWPIDGGKDLSLGRNYEDAASIFAHECDQDFFGSYDADLDRGVVACANHHVLPGKKAWTWGYGGYGRMHQMDLTDEDGPYNEVQTGPLRTQADVGRLDPHEAIAWKEWWYPVRGIGGFTYATPDVAVNASRAGGQLRLRAMATGTWSPVEVVVSAGGQPVARGEAALSPAGPAEVSIEVGEAPDPLEVEFRLPASGGPGSVRAIRMDGTEAVPPPSAAGGPGSVRAYGDSALAHPTPLNPALLNPALLNPALLNPALAHPTLLNPTLANPRQGADGPAPSESRTTLLARFTVPLVLPVREPPAPRERGETPSELVLAGWEDFLFARFPRARERFEKALEEDPRSPSARTGLALLSLDAAPAKAAAEARSALDVDPDHGLARYALGVAELRLGNEEAALAAAWKAATDPALAAAGRALAAKVLIRRGEWREVVDVLSEPGPWESDPVATNRLALALWKLGEASRATAIASQNLRVDPLDALARSIFWLTGRESSEMSLARLVLGKPQSTLELAAAYADLGEDEIALRILETFHLSMAREGQADPVACYLAAHLAARTGRPEDAAAYLERARSASPEGVFPHRPEEVAPLRWALAADEDDAKAALYLGHLLFSLGDLDGGRAYWRRASEAGGASEGNGASQGSGASEGRGASEVSGASQGRGASDGSAASARGGPSQASPASGGSRATEGARTKVIALRALGAAALALDGDRAAAAKLLDAAHAADPLDAIVAMDLVRVLSARADAESDAAAKEKHLARMLEVLQAAFQAGKGRSDFVALLARAQNRLGRYEATALLLDLVRITIWEGAREVHDLYEEAHLGLGKAHLEAGLPGEALRHFNRALEYPENLATGKLEGAREAHIHYLRGRALAGLGLRDAALAAWKKAADEPASKDPRKEEARRLAREALEAAFTP